MERLNPMDAQFVDAEDEDRNASFAIASIAVFEGPAPSYEEFYAAVEGRLPLVPIYRRKLRTVPFRLGPPVWVDDPNFDLHYHIRQTALPAPGGDEQLADLVALVMTQRLDRHFPLWEYWLVEGLGEGRWALISKIHHAMVDGISGADMYRVLFDLSPEPGPPVVQAPQLAAEPNGLALAASAAADLVARPARGAMALASALSRPRDTARQAAQTARAVAKLAGSASPAARSSLSGAISRQRRYAWARGSLSEVKTIKNELGGTVNDVILAAVSSGFRTLLLSRGEHPLPHMVPSLIPVSTRAPGEEGIPGNQVSVMLADLPVHLSEPVERLTVVRAEMSALKTIRAESAAEALVALGRFTPYPLASQVVRLGYRIPHEEIATVTTNVPGPQQPLYALGRKLVELVPYVPIATNLRTGVSIFSYCGQLTFGITGDYATTPDIDVLARGIEHGIEELTEAVHRRRAGQAG
ncbi:MAG TPA: wax ester/triacylglycerol synthase family O-acyltransferase [Streptosporangiaceae bacterium]|jgi:diacylglycerol O-acyltransferase